MVSQINFENTYGILSHSEKVKPIDDLIQRRAIFKTLIEDKSKFPLLTSKGIRASTLSEFVEEGSFFEKLKKKYSLYKSSDLIDRALNDLNSEVSEVAKTIKKPTTARDTFNFLTRRQNIYQEHKYLNGVLFPLRKNIEEARSQFIAGIPTWLKTVFSVIQYFERSVPTSFVAIKGNDFEVPDTIIGKDIKLRNIHLTQMTVDYKNSSFQIYLNDGLFYVDHYANDVETIQFAVELFLANSSATKLIIRAGTTLFTYGGLSSNTPKSIQHDLKAQEDAKKMGQEPELFIETNATLIKKEGKLLNIHNEEAIVHYHSEPMTWPEYISKKPILNF